MRTARIDRWNDRATVVHDPDSVGVDAMLAAVAEAGFEASVATADRGSADSGSAGATRDQPPVDAPEDGHRHGPEHSHEHDP